MKTSDEFYEELRTLDGEVYSALVEALKKNGGEFKPEFSFPDEANNEVDKVDIENVYFNGETDTYPLSDMGIKDMLYVLSNLE
jgi:hypothetical protein